MSGSLIDKVLFPEDEPRGKLRGELFKLCEEQDAYKLDEWVNNLAGRLDDVIVKLDIKSLSDLQYISSALDDLYDIVEDLK